MFITVVMLNYSTIEISLYNCTIQYTNPNAVRSLTLALYKLTYFHGLFTSSLKGSHLSYLLHFMRVSFARLRKLVLYSQKRYLS